MSLALRVVLVVVTLSFLIYILTLVKRNKLELRYSFLWIVLGLLVLIGAVFPHLVTLFSTFLGFQITSNFVFFVALFFVLLMCVSLCVVISEQSRQIKTLTQEISLIKLDNQQGRSQDKKQDMK